MVRLGLNIDHIATLRNARGGTHPDPVELAQLAGQSGVDGITVHLREDRRHIRDEDVVRLKSVLSLPMNLEIAATEEMLAIACEVKPHAVCLVPEKREELTTEGGLNVVANTTFLTSFIKVLTDAGIRVSLFIDPDLEQVKAAHEVNAPVVEFHTGSYCEDQSDAEFERIRKAVELADSFGIECHAGHGLDYISAARVASLPQIKELNIGHFMIGEAITDGLPTVIQKMKQAVG